jgi:pimeloyl-ACP methyl ester carboxylesterase
LSPDLLSGKLIKFLESLESNHSETPHEKRGAIVVAHSLGGLITRHAVNQRPDLFAGVVFAGTPQHCVNILGPLRNGDDVLLSSRVLTAQVNFTIRTSFALLPEDGRCFIQKHTNHRYDLDFFDPHTWEEYHLSPCINPPLEHRLREKDKDDRGRSIIGALSDSIAATNRRSSWFGTGPSPGQSSQHTAARDSLEAAEQQMSDKALEAGQDEQRHAEGMVGPSMKQDHHRPTVATAVTIPKDLAAEYLDRTLAEVRVFKQELRFISSHQENNIYPPHAFIFGKTVPTVYGVRVPNEEAIKYTDAFDDLAFAAGDGVVLASAAQLPDGYRCVKGGRVESDRGHVGLMGDLEGMGRCIGAVIDARRKGVGLGTLYARHSRDMSDGVEP